MKLPTARSSFLLGLGMLLFAALRIQHFFNSNFQEFYGWKGSLCDVNSWLNCTRLDFSILAQIDSIPFGYFELMVGGWVAMGGLFPSRSLERTNRSLALPNVAVVFFLFAYSTLVLHSLCLWEAGYGLFSILSCVVLRQRVNSAEQAGFARTWFRPPLRHLLAFLVIFAVGAYWMQALQSAKRQTMYVSQYFSLPKIKLPSLMSPYWLIRSTDRFEDATIRIVEFSDVICDNSKFVDKALERLSHEFPGKMNVAFQFFPLETKCNHVVDKNKHPGACEAAYIAAYDPAKFKAIHDEFFDNYYEAQKPEWRRKLAKRYGVEAAFTDAKTKQIVQDLIQTGAEYPPTSDIYPYGIRSVPTLIVNDRMIIGTLSYDQLRPIFQAIVDNQTEKRDFIETWYDRANDLKSWLFRVLNIVT